MKLSEISYDIMTMRSLQEVSDDDMTLLQIQYWITVTRSQLIRQAINKGQNPSTSTQQTISCLPVIEVSRSECPCEVTPDCTILRTQQQIPVMIETYKGTMLHRVKANMIANIPISIIQYERSPYVNSNSLTQNITKAFLYNRYIYLISEVLIDSITISGTFEDPLEIANYTSCEGIPCFSIDTMEYPISSAMINDLKGLVVNLNFKSMNFLVDKVNNANDSKQQDINK